MIYKPLGDKSAQSWIDNLSSNELFNDLSRNQKILYIDSIQQECAKISKLNNLEFYKNTELNLLIYVSRASLTINKQILSMDGIVVNTVSSGTMSILIKKQTVSITSLRGYGSTLAISVKKQTMAITGQTRSDLTLIASYSESNQNYNGALATGQKLGQSVMGIGESMPLCKFYLKREGTGGGGNFIAKVYAHSGTFGTSSVPTGSSLVDSNPVAVSTLGLAYTLISFIFDTPYTLANGTPYVIVLDFTGTTSGGNQPVFGAKSGNPHGAGNDCLYYDGAWHANASVGLCYYLYNTIVYNSTIAMSIKKQSIFITSTLKASISLSVSIKKQLVSISAELVSGDSIGAMALNINKQLVSIDGSFT
jgi:hypothetical protein